jgi:hypothetical protein
LAGGVEEGAIEVGPFFVDDGDEGEVIMISAALIIN